MESQRLGYILVQNPIKCDAEQNLYLRRYQATDADTYSAPVIKISKDGKSPVVFSIGVAPGFERGAAFDFALGLRGEIYLLAGKSLDERNIVKFREDGQHDSTIKLDRIFDPSQLAVFLSGEFLISGVKLSNKGKSTGEAFTAVFDSEGRLLREITLPGDVKPEKVEAGGKVQIKENAAISLGMAVASDDGNIYLMRASRNALIYVISPAGEVLRRFVISPPAEKFQPHTMSVAGRRIVLEFVGENPGGMKAQPKIFSLVDAQSGERLYNYFLPPTHGGIFACYSPNGFLFLGSSKDQKLTVIQAVP